mgnify:CR=1 FL=1
MEEEEASGRQPPRHEAYLEHHDFAAQVLLRLPHMEGTPLRAVPVPRGQRAGVSDSRDGKALTLESARPRCSHTAVTAAQKDWLCFLRT